jgi:hypothetical protein
MASFAVKKRGLDSFFTPVHQKKARIDNHGVEEPGKIANLDFSRHSTYPFPVPYLPSFISNHLPELPAVEGREIHDQADLDLVYFQPCIPKSVERQLFEFLRQELFFYRVQYKIKRGSTETQITTPR